MTPRGLRDGWRNVDVQDGSRRGSTCPTSRCTMLKFLSQVSKRVTRTGIQPDPADVACPPDTDTSPTQTNPIVPSPVTTAVPVPPPENQWAYWRGNLKDGY